jgi:threonine aldolase
VDRKTGLPMNFISDNTAAIAPEILQAIAAANQGAAHAYGEDPWTQELDGLFSDFFATKVRVFPVVTGTAANALALATLTPCYGAILTHADAHVVRDECGAPEFMSGGARLLTVAARGGKISPEAVIDAIAANPPSVHAMQPAVVSITQATEFGTCYTPGEIASLSAAAHAHGLSVHMDGARIANAIAFLGCSPADITWRAGVDVLSFGATKNGAMAAEAIVFLRSELARDLEQRRKRAGHLLSKMRFVSAQLAAYIRTGIWLRNAQRANALAQRIAAAAAPWLMHPVEANELFLSLGTGRSAALRAMGFEFYDWGAAGSGEARFVVSWDQSESDVAGLCDALRALQERPA